jgi:hypothetical protein
MPVVGVGTINCHASTMIVFIMSSFLPLLSTYHVTAMDGVCVVAAG